MRISNVVNLRDEVISGEVHGWISLRGLFEGGKEADAEYVFGITYPSAEIKNLLEAVEDKLQGRRKTGFFELMGGYGTGKSHILLLLYHLFKNPRKGEEWLRRHGISLGLPSEATVIPLQLMDYPPEYLWEPIFNGLGKENLLKKVTAFPGAMLLKEAIKDRETVVIIIDELESWYRSVRDKDSNLNFIQVLAEVACEEPNLIVFSALYGEEGEITARTGRVKPYRVNLTQSKDRPKIVLFRLIKNLDENKASQVISNYISHYSRSELEIENMPQYEQLMTEYYPIHPELMRVLLEQYSASPNYQNTRGVLFLLSSILGKKHDITDLLLTSDVDMEEPDLLSLDRQLVENARKDAEAIGEALAKSILNVILLYSFGEEKVVGVSRDKIVSGTLRPQININDIDEVLTSLPDVAPHVWIRNGKYVVGRRANVVTLIHNRAIEHVKRGQINNAVEIIKSKLRRDISHYIYHPNKEFTDEIPDTDKIKIVVSLKALNQSEIGDFYKGKEYPNRIILYIPKEGDITKNIDILTIAERLHLSSKFKEGASADNRRLIEDMESRDNKHLRDKLFSEIYGYWVKITGFIDGKVTSYRLIPCSIGDLRNKVKAAYNIDTIKDEILNSLEGKEVGLKLEDILYDFSTKPGKPIILTEMLFNEAVKSLHEEGEIIIEYKGKTYTKDAGLPSLKPSMKVMLGKYYRPPVEVVEEKPHKPIEPPIEKAPPTMPVAEEGRGEISIIKTLPKQPPQVITISQVPSIFRLSEELERRIPRGKKINSAKLLFEDLEFKDFGGFRDFIKRMANTVSGKTAVPSKVCLTLEFKEAMSKEDLIKLVDNLPVISGREVKLQAEVEVE